MLRWRLETCPGPAPALSTTEGVETACERGGEGSERGFVGLGSGCGCGDRRVGAVARWKGRGGGGGEEG